MTEINEVALSLRSWQAWKRVYMDTTIP